MRIARSGRPGTQMALSAPTPTTMVPSATPDNQYLGFCRGAVNLQNGDKKASFQKNKDAGAWSRNGSNKKISIPYFMACREPKCAFRSNFVSSDPELLWTKVHVYPDLGIKIRWPFLAKSHVPQRVVVGGHYYFKCLFCVYLGRCGAMEYNCMANYLSHISLEHRGKTLGDVIEYKTSSIIGRIAHDTEQFDINIWPTTANDNVLAPGGLSNDDPRSFSIPRPNASITRPQTMASLSIDIERDRDYHNGTNDHYNLLNATGETVSPTVARNAAQHTTRPLALQSNLRRAIPDGDSLTISFAQDAITNPEANPWTEVESSYTLDRCTEMIGWHTREHCTHTFSEASDDHDLEPGPALRPEIPPRSELRRLDTNMRQRQEDVIANGDNLSTCLDDIAQLLRDALALVSEAKRQAATYQRAPPPPLLEHTLLDVASDLQKQRQRALIRYGSAFEFADPLAIIALQRVIIQLHNSLLRPLGRAAHDSSINNFETFIDVAESGASRITSVLQEVKERLNQPLSGRRTSQLPQSNVHQDFRARSPSQTGSLEAHRDVSLHGSFASSNHRPSPLSVPCSARTPSNEGQDTRRRVSVLSLLKSGRKKHIAECQAGAGDPASPSHLISIRHGMVKLDFRNRKGTEGCDGSPKAFKLDGVAPGLPAQ